MPQNPVRIDVVSDVVCPWCYLGKARLEEALRLVPEIHADVHWHPFQLDPTIPPEGMDRDAYMRRKFGDLDRLRGAHQRLEEAGREAGIAYRFDAQKRAANTLDAHRLVRWAGESGKEAWMVDRLFRLYFTEGADVGDRGVLADAAAEAGMDRTDIEARLASDRDRAAVQAEIAMWQRAGITGVPCFVLDRRYAVMGAQEPEAIADALRQVAEGEAARATA